MLLSWIKQQLHLKNEQRVLVFSIFMTVFVAVIGIIFGLASGSFSIVFDGTYALVDACMSILSLLVVRLITFHATSTHLSNKTKERFSMGFWHLEPMVLALNGILLSSVAIYALINAINFIIQGGRVLKFDWAIVYAVITVIICVLAAMLEANINKVIKSDFLRMDIKGWIMSASITGALLIAFFVGILIQDTSLQWIAPYIDPVILVLVCLVIIPMPIGVVKQALSDIFMLTPHDLKEHVDDVAQRISKKYGFITYRSYVAKMGRSREIELYFIVPHTASPQKLQHWDLLRDEVGKAIGGEGPNRWLTVVFTEDKKWVE